MNSCWHHFWSVMISGSPSAMLPEYSPCECFTPGSLDTCTLCLGSRTFSLSSLLSNTRLHSLTYSYLTHLQLVMTFLQSWSKVEEEASLEHAQCARARVIGRNSQESSAGDPLNTTRKEWTWSNVKNTITFKLYKVSIPCIQWETHQTSGNNTCVNPLCGQEKQHESSTMPAWRCMTR